jgi:hypothetical protein
LFQRQHGQYSPLVHPVSLSPITEKSSLHAGYSFQDPSRNLPHADESAMN